jgi:ELWxxDGT repeat protein
VTDAFSDGIPLRSEAVSVPTGRSTELCFGGPGVKGGELFCYDGSTLRQVSGVSNIRNLAVYDGTLYFQAYTPSTGNELYQYDGTSVTRVADLNPGPAASKPHALTVYDGALYFKADVGNGFELWRYDGTSPTTVSDFASSGTELAPFADFATYDGSLYVVTASDELWAYDGSSLSRAATVQSMRTFPELTVYAGTLYFVASTNSTGNAEFELTEFDGTGASTAVDLNGSESGLPASFAVYDDGTGRKLYFAAGSSSGRELFRFDGSTASKVAEINGTGSSDPGGLTVYDDGSGASLYFRADDGNSGTELWRFDDSGPALAEDLNPGAGNGSPGSFVTYDDGSGTKLYFEANGGIGAYGLYSYDGSSVELQTSTNVFTTRFSDKLVYDDGSGDRLYFAGDGDDAGDELYRTDGSQVTLAADINSGNRSSDPRGFTAYEGALYFRAFTPNSGSELWTYDESGASLVEDINASSSTSITLSSRPSGFTVYNNTLYFAAATGGEGVPGDGVELWRYDGSTVQQVKDLNPGSDSGIPDQGPDFTVADLGSGRSLYFVGDDGSSGRELYRYDGSSVQRVTTINQSGNSFYCCSGTPLTLYDGALYFSATDGSDGRELYRYDGTTATRVKDINPGSGGAAALFDRLRRHALL